MKNSRIKTLHSLEEFRVAIENDRYARFDKILYYLSIFLLSGTVIGGIFFFWP